MRKEKIKIFGDTVFVPLDKTIEPWVIEKNYYHKTCEWCGTEFVAKYPTAKFCTPSHKASAGRKRQEDRLRVSLKEIDRLKQEIKVLKNKEGQK